MNQTPHISSRKFRWQWYALAVLSLSWPPVWAIFVQPLFDSPEISQRELLQFLQAARFTIKSPPSGKHWSVSLESIVDGSVSSETFASVPPNTDIVLYIDQSNQKLEIPFVCIVEGSTIRGTIPSPMTHAVNSGTRVVGTIASGDWVIVGSRHGIQLGPDSKNDFEVRVRLTPSL